MAKTGLITIICIIFLGFFVSCSKNSQEEAKNNTNIDTIRDTFSEEKNDSGDSIPAVADQGNSAGGSSTIQFKY